MSIAADVAALRNRFRMEWGSRHPAMPVLWDNASVIDPPTGAPYVRFAVRPGEMRRGHIGEGQGPYRSLGRVWVQIFVPSESGPRSASEIADDVAEIYRRWRSADGAVRTDNVEITDAGKDGNWHQTNVSVRQLS